MTNRNVPPSESSEFAGPVPVEERLGALEAKISTMQAIGVEAETCFREQTKGVAQLASEVYTYEVVAKRDKLWRSVATVVQHTTPFRMEYRPCSLVSLQWNFHDMAVPLGPYGYSADRHTVADVAIRTSLDLGSGSPVVQEVDTALTYARDKPVFTKRALPKAPLGAGVQKIGLRTNQFSETDLTSRAIAEIVEQASSLDATMYTGYNYTNSLHQNRHGVVHEASIEQRNFLGGMDGTADLLKLRTNVDAAYSVDVLGDLAEELWEYNARTVGQSYKYLHDTYIADDKRSLDNVAAVDDWLHEDRRIAPVTPASFLRTV